MKHAIGYTLALGLLAAIAVNPHAPPLPEGIGAAAEILPAIMRKSNPRPKG